jgi:hypothetical protein
MRRALLCGIASAGLVGAGLFAASCGGTGDTSPDATADGNFDSSSDAAPDASVDVEFGDAASDALTDVLIDAAPCTVSIMASILAGCGTSATCFPPSGSPVCDPTLVPCSSANDWFYFCGTTAACSGTTTFCCVPPSVPVTSGACGTISPGGTEAVCGYQCNADGGHQLCTTDSECAAGVGGTCKPKFVSGLAALDGSVLGVCE